MKALLLLFLSSIFASGIAHEVHVIYQAHSLHGTDIAEKFEGETVQAAVHQFSAVTVGALPESLVDAVVAPHKLNGPDSYKVPEANLLVLCGIELMGEMTDKGFVCHFDLSNLSIPEEVDLSVRTILKLSIQSLKSTLDSYYRVSKTSEKVKIEIKGTSEKNKSLKDLATSYTSGK